MNGNSSSSNVKFCFSSHFLPYWVSTVLTTCDWRKPLPNPKSLATFSHAQTTVVAVVVLIVVVVVVVVVEVVVVVVLVLVEVVVVV